MAIRDELEDDAIFGSSSAVEHITTTQGNNYAAVGALFKPVNPATDVILVDVTEGWIQAKADGIGFVCPISLPDNATITEVIVYGNSAAAAETWSLKSVRISDVATQTMATANINTSDTSISPNRIDNSTKAYFISTSSLDTDDLIGGVLIKYKFAG